MSEAAPRGRASRTGPAGSDDRGSVCTHDDFAPPSAAYDCVAILQPCSVLRAAAAATVGAAIPDPAVASPAETLSLLKQARSQLDPCDAFIDDGAWDSVRTTVKTAPLQNVKNLVTQYIAELASDSAEDLVVPREDFVQALQLLDMNVYNNVFVGEQNGQGKKGAGVKIDRDNPRRYLREAKVALDEIVLFQP